jgi:hypothetical protein
MLINAAVPAFRNVIKKKAENILQYFFFISNSTTCPYGLRGLPSWAWQ